MAIIAQHVMRMPLRRVVEHHARRELSGVTPGGDSEPGAEERRHGAAMNAAMNSECIGCTPRLGMGCAAASRARDPVDADALEATTTGARELERAREALEATHGRCATAMDALAMAREDDERRTMTAMAARDAALVALETARATRWEVEAALEGEKTRMQGEIEALERRAEAARAEAEALETTLETTREETRALEGEIERKRMEIEGLDVDAERAIERLRTTVEEETRRVKARAESAARATAAPVRELADAEARKAMERALETRFKTELEASRAPYERTISELRSKLSLAETAKDVVESERASLQRRIDALEERLGRDKLALEDATSALETRGQLIDTLKRRIDTLERRETEALDELRRARGDALEELRRLRSVERVRVIEAPPESPPSPSSRPSSARRAALDDVRRELSELAT